METSKVIPFHKEKIVQVDFLRNAPNEWKAFAHYAQYWLQKENLTDVSFLDGSERALFCLGTSGDNSFKEIPIGLLVWFEDEDEDCWWVQIAYVHEDHRGRGIINQLFQELCEEANREGMPLITVGTHVRNASMQKALTKIGAIQEYQLWNLRPRGEADSAPFS